MRSEIVKEVLPGNTSYCALERIARECGGRVEVCGDATHGEGESGHRSRIFPCSHDDPGAIYRGWILVAQGWDGGKLYAVTARV